MESNYELKKLILNAVCIIMLMILKLKIVIFIISIG